MDPLSWFEQEADDEGPMLLMEPYRPLGSACPGGLTRPAIVAVWERSAAVRAESRVVRQQCAANRAKGRAWRRQVFV